MKIRSLRDIERVRSIIGDENADAATKAHRDGCQQWIFTSQDEVDRSRSLNSAEREFCRKRFSDGEPYAGICRSRNTSAPLGRALFIRGPLTGNWSH
ncbi:hypothetical protein HZA86_02245 [Candidatus Uhrbacteria bacterium]|nr:hypothetical protein [Candidatus Uhrbacteria bacterium]